MEKVRDKEFRMMIAEKYNNGTRVIELAREYGLSQQTIYNYINESLGKFVPKKNELKKEERDRAVKEWLNSYLSIDKMAELNCVSVRMFNKFIDLYVKEHPEYLKHDKVKRLTRYGYKGEESIEVFEKEPVKKERRLHPIYVGSSAMYYGY